MTAAGPPEGAPEPALLAEIERTAVDLARLAGAEIQGSLGRAMAVSYKAGADARAVYRDPVSEVDRRCEEMIRARLDEVFPTHGVVGEEMDEKPGDVDEYVWAVDPIDGTTNFVNGFPLFAAVVGVLRHGRPVAGAVWCSVTHALRPGTYHASTGSGLKFEGEALTMLSNPAVLRRLAGEPHAPKEHDLGWEVRKTGSAAIECAFVAAGLLNVARFERPNVWDVAGGIVLVEAAGGVVYAGHPDGWRRFAGFGPADGYPDMRTWRHPLVLGDAGAARQMVVSLEPGFAG